MTREELQQMARDFCNEHCIGEVVGEVEAMLLCAAKSGLNEEYPREQTGDMCGQYDPGCEKTWCGLLVGERRYRTTIIPKRVTCPVCKRTMSFMGIDLDGESMGGKTVSMLPGPSEGP